MRQRMHGRGLMPIFRSSLLRAWTFDDIAPASIRELIGGSLNLVQAGSVDTPEVFQSPYGTRSRAFNRVTDTTQVLASGDASGDSFRIQGSWTISCWVRIFVFDEDPPPAFPDRIWTLSGDRNLETEVANAQASLTIDSNGNFGSYWESGAGTDRLITFTSLVAPVNKWLKVTLRKRIDAGSNYFVDLIVNGEVVETSASTPNATGGSDSTVRWQVGGHLNGANVLADASRMNIASLSVYEGALDLEDIVDDHRNGYLLDCYQSQDLRVELEDASGNRRDMGDLDGVDFVDGATVNIGTDLAVATATVNLLREQHDLSIAPERTDTKLNLTDVDNVNSYDPLVAAVRDVEVFTAMSPLGVTPSGIDWQSRFLGRTDKPDSGGDGLTLNARGPGARLVDTVIEEEVLNPAILPGEPPEKQPSYGLPSPGEPVATVIQKILNDNDNNAANDSVVGLVPRLGSYDPITLVTEGIPNWSMVPYRQKRQPVMTAIRTLAGQIGWDVKFAYVNGVHVEGDGFFLVFKAPDRTQPYPDLIVTDFDVGELSQFGIDVKKVRTPVRVTYPSSELTLPTPSVFPGYAPARQGWSSVDGAGQRLPAFVELEHIATRDELDRRYMEVGEESASQVDTVAEAGRMCFSLSEDVRNPEINAAGDTRALPLLEANDYVRFNAIREQFTQPRQLAILGGQHRLGVPDAFQFQASERAAVGRQRWLDLESNRPGQGRPAVADPLAALTDTNRGPDLRVLRELMDRSDYQTGGKYLTIKNQDVQFFSGGLQAPPDSWKMDAGTWGTDILEEGVITQSGGHSLEFPTTVGTITSDLFPIAGENDVPYSFEVEWQRSAAVSRAPRMTVTWYAADRTTPVGAAAVLTPGGAAVPPAYENMPAVSTAAGVWFRSRVDGVHPPAGARFARISLDAQGGAGVATLYVDSVTGYRTSRAARSAPDTAVLPGGWGTATPGAGIYNQPMTSVQASVLVANVYDRGIQMVNDSLSAFPNNGYHFLCREPGTYEVVIDAIGFASVNGAYDYDWLLRLNDTFNAGGLSSGAGTSEAQRDVARTYAGAGAPGGPDQLTTEITLNRDDRLSLGLEVATGPGLLQIQSGLVTVPSIMAIKIRGLD